VSDKTLSACRYGKCNRREALYEGTAGERIAVRLSSGDTNGIYAIVESVAAPGYSPPMHLHRNEEKHFVVLASTYRIVIEDTLFDAPVPALWFQKEPSIVSGTKHLINTRIKIGFLSWPSPKDSESSTANDDEGNNPTCFQHAPFLLCLFPAEVSGRSKQHLHDDCPQLKQATRLVSPRLRPLGVSEAHIEFFLAKRDKPENRRQ
jgi:hypothetical protein